MMYKLYQRADASHFEVVQYITIGKIYISHVSETLLCWMKYQNAIDYSKKGVSFGEL